MDGKPDVVVVGAGSTPGERRLVGEVVRALGDGGAWVWGPYLGVESRPLPLTAAVLVVCTPDVELALRENPEEVHALFWHSETRGALAGLPGEPSVFAVLPAGEPFERVPEALREVPVVRWPGERATLLEALGLNEAAAEVTGPPASRRVASPTLAPVEDDPPSPPPPRPRRAPSTLPASAEVTEERTAPFYELPSVHDASLGGDETIPRPPPFPVDPPAVEVALPPPEAAPRPVAPPPPAQAVAQAGRKRQAPVAPPPEPAPVARVEAPPEAPPAEVRPPARLRPSPARAPETARPAPPPPPAGPTPGGLDAVAAAVAARTTFGLVPVEVPSEEVALALATVLGRAGMDVRVWHGSRRPWKSLPGWLEAQPAGQRRVLLASLHGVEPMGARDVLEAIDGWPPHRRAEVGSPLVVAGPRDTLVMLANTMPNLWAVSEPPRGLSLADVVRGAFEVRLPRPAPLDLDLASVLKRWDMSRGFAGGLAPQDVALALIRRADPGDVERAASIVSMMRLASDTQAGVRLVAARVALERGDLATAESMADTLVAEGSATARGPALLIRACIRLRSGRATAMEVSNEVAGLARAERAGTVPVEALVLLGRHWAVEGDLANARGAFLTAGAQADALSAGWLGAEARADLQRLERFLAG